MTVREPAIWILAIATSLLLHAGLLWQDRALFSADDGRAKKQAGVTHLSFQVVKKPQPPTPVPEVKPQPKPPEPPKPKPKPPEPKRAKEPAPVIEPEPEPEPVVTEASPPAPVQTAGDPQELERARQHYLGKLLAHIEQQKFYPRAARRRGLQGVIQVSFVLHENGTVSELRVEDGHDVLIKAAEEAVQAALPLPRPPRDVPCPLRVSYGMEFKLN